jgi:hypothetical protein
MSISTISILMEDRVTCPICGSMFKRLSPHLIHKHGLTTSDVKQLYPELKLVSDDVRKRISQTCIERGVGEWRRGAELTSEQRLHLSQMNAGENNPFYGCVHSDETRARMHRNHADFTGDNNPLTRWLANDPNRRTEYSAELKRAWERIRSDEARYKERCDIASRSTAELYARGKPRGYGRGHRAAYVESKKAGRVWCRSSYEKLFVEACDVIDCVNYIQTCPFVIEYLDGEKRRRYVPDFLINGTIIIEIKAHGMVHDPHVQLKAKAAEKYAVEHHMSYVMLSQPERFADDVRRLVEMDG